MPDTDERSSRLKATAKTLYGYAMSAAFMLLGAYMGDPVLMVIGIAQLFLFRVTNNLKEDSADIATTRQQVDDGTTSEAEFGEQFHTYLYRRVMHFTLLTALWLTLGLTLVAHAVFMIRSDQLLVAGFELYVAVYSFESTVIMYRILKANKERLETLRKILP